MKRIVSYVSMLVFGILLIACSNAGYTHVIPEGSTAIVSVDVSALKTQTKLEKGADSFLSLLHVTDPADCGLDFGSKLYFFETPDGSLGLAAKVASRNKLEKLLTGMSKSKMARPIIEKKGLSFTVLSGKWVIGISDKAMMAMGPALGNVQTQLMSQMTKWLTQDEDNSVVGTPMFEKLDSIQGAVAMVAQAQALPEQLVSLFTLGAPKDADASQVSITVEMSVSDGQLLIKGETFSFNKRINEVLQQSSKVFRPVKGNYGNIIDNGRLFSLFMNVAGKEFLPLMRQNKFLQSLLMGVNTAIDMDNIINSIDGDVAFTANSLDANHLDLAMGAEMSSLAFVGDIGYWKQSCPKGSGIVDWQKNGWVFMKGKQNYYFGVNADSSPLFFSGTDLTTALMMSKPVSSSLQYKGEKLVAIIQLSQVNNDLVKTAILLLEPVFGNLNSIVYIRK